MRPLLSILLGGALVLPAAARPGLVHTLDGRSLNGDVLFTNGTFVVNATNAIPLTNLLALTFDSPAPGPAGPRGSGLGLLGYYFANTNLAGDAFVRLDETIQFDWGEGEPGPDLPRDQFSVAWGGELEAPATGDYQFALDGLGAAQFVLAGKTIIDAAADSASNREAPSVGLQTGVRYPIQIRYVNASGPARVRLLWTGPELPQSVVPRDRLFPKSSLTNHTATPGTNAQGLLATYYAKSDFTGPSWTRIDPGIDFEWANIDPLPGVARTNFSVRWSGQVLAEQTESYTFHVLADEPTRLWVGGKLLLATGGDNFYFERRESLPLNGGERYDLRLETQSTGGSATAKLSWSSGSTPKAIVPVTHLFSSRPTATRGAMAISSDKTPPGLLLRNGSFLAGTVERASESSLRLAGRSAPFSTVNIARILLQPLAPRLAERIVAGRAGVLLARGDFVDAEFRGLENGQLLTSSILFGPRSYSAEREALAVVLRDAALSAYAYEIRLLDQTLLHAASLTIENDELVVRDAMAGTVKVAFADIALLKRAR